MTGVRGILLGAALVANLATPALAVTPAELAALSRAGLSDQVLLALIEATGVDHPVDAQGALELQGAGVSQAVIAAAVRASHLPVAEPGLQATPPDVLCDGCDNIAVIGGTAPPGPDVLQRDVSYVHVPWVVAVPGRGHLPHKARPYFEGDRGFGRFINDGTTGRRTPPARGRPGTDRRARVK